MSSILFLLSLSPVAHATTWTVNSGGSIQSTIASATSGDTIEISSGIYSECIDPSGKNLTLQGMGSVTISAGSCTSTITVSGSETVTINDLQLKHPGGMVVSVGPSATVSLSGVTITNSGTTNRSASSLGGVIYTEGFVQIADSSFSSNSGGLGGVIYAYGGLVSIENSTFSSNTALKGGVMFAEYGTSIFSTGNTFTGNMTVNGGFGGAFAFNFGVEFTDSNSTFDSNMSSSNGGVIYAYHNVGSFQPNVISLTNSLFDGNQAGAGSSSTTGHGGALYIYNRSKVTVVDSTFVDNTATNGGAIWVVASDDTLTVENTTFTQNVADQSGAIGVLADGVNTPTDLLISDCSFVDNEANNGFGGAISLGSLTTLQSHGTVIIENTIFDGNVSKNSQHAKGGAVLINTSSSNDVVFDNVQFLNNDAHASGGAVYIDGPQNLSFSKSRFLNNSASSPASYTRYGGALSLHNTESIELNNSILCGNEVTKFSTLDAFGGSLYVDTVLELDIHNVIFQENSSDQKGGAIALYGVDSTSLINNTFVGNSSTQGDDLWLTLSPTQIINNIFAYASSSASLYAADGVSATNGASYNDWYNNTANTSGSFGFSVSSSGNLINDPIFALFSQDGNCSNDVLTLQASSPLVDQGDPTKFDTDGTRSDMGAFGGSGLVDGDGDGFGALVDCDDNDADTFPGAAFLESASSCMTDVDGDGYGDSNPSGAATPGQDCDDSNPSIKPGGIEFCDGVDNDCDNQIDDNPVGGSLYYADADGDGFGGTTTIQSCSAVNGASSITGDCDDLDPFAFPGSAENESATTCMRDVDGDGYGDSSPSNTSISSGSDCNDMQPAIYPGATEIAGDGTDQNCDGIEACFQDADLDGFGSTVLTNSASFTCTGLAISANDDDCDDDAPQTFPGAAENESATACMQDNDGDGYGYMFAPSGGVGGNDCNDNEPSVYFGATEIPGDGISQDCDNKESCYQDSDGDGFGSTAIVQSLDLDCTDAGEASNAADCDDANASISPNATEIPYDGVDQDCDPSTADDDLDGDGYGVSDGDCDDGNATRNPGATDVPDDGIDQDCDGMDATEEPEDTAVPEDTSNPEPDVVLEPDDTNDTDITETELDPKEGCSTVSTAELGYFAMLFAMLGLRRRQSH